MVIYLMKLDYTEKSAVLRHEKENAFTIHIDDGLSLVQVQAMAGDCLLDVIRKSGKPMFAPCGGKGTCKKCLANIQGSGPVLACRHRISGSFSGVLPTPPNMQIVEHDRLAKNEIDNDSGIAVLISERRTVLYNGEMLFIDENKSSDKYGLAVDVGTTTIALFLLDLSTGQLVDSFSMINPQSAYGADVISRVSYCLKQEGGVAELQRVLIGGMNDAIALMCEKNNVSPDDIFMSAIVGNTVMQHILCGVNPAPIAFAPYTPVFIDEKLLRGADLNVRMHKSGLVKVLPSIAEYVGADIVAGIAATDMLSSSSYSLYIDIGTNGEMVIGNSEKLYCCATAAGPAFEGAKISCGVGGISGAISEFIDSGYAVIGGGAPVGLCGSALIDVTAALLERGLVDQSGYMESDFEIASAAETATGLPIVLTPNDVREVQLAKAAIYAGIAALLKEANVSFDDIERLYLAGGFGNYIREESAVRIGLLPRELAGKIIPIGNSAGAGARYALKSAAFASQISAVLEKAEYIELSTSMDFNEAYVAAMGFH